MRFKCFFGHTKIELCFNGGNYEYCLRCRKLWIYQRIFFLVNRAAPENSPLRGYEGWQEIFDLEQKTEFEDYLKSLKQM